MIGGNIKYYRSTVQANKCNPELPLQAETAAYIDRVEADGGVVNDPYFVNLFYYTVKSLGLYNHNMWHAIIPQSGVRLRVVGSDKFVEKVYDLSPNNHDPISVSEDRQPYLLQDYSTKCNPIFSIWNGGRSFSEGGLRTMFWDQPGKLFIQNQTKITSIFNARQIDSSTGGHIYYVTNSSNAGAQYNVSFWGSSNPYNFPSLITFGSGTVDTRLVMLNKETGMGVVKSGEDEYAEAIPTDDFSGDVPLSTTLFARVANENNNGQVFSQHFNALIGFRDVLSEGEYLGVFDFLNKYFKP